MIGRRPGPTVRTKVSEFRSGTRVDHEDRLATEEPLEIRVTAPGLASHRLGITMRTPGHDFELAAGWMVHERIASPEAVTAVRYCSDEELSDLEQFNVVTVELSTPPLRLPGARALSSACGVCGSDTVDELVADLPGVRRVELAVEVVTSLPQRLRSAQPTFERTGGLHAAGLAQVDGTLVAAREDVGRHNAVDKVVGSRLLGALDVPPVLVLSGRVGFELVQKAVVSGIGAIVSVGAPSSLAVSLAERSGLLLAGFVRDDRLVAYAGADRLNG